MPRDLTCGMGKTKVRAFTTKFPEDFGAGEAIPFFHTLTDSQFESGPAKEPDNRLSHIFGRRGLAERTARTEAASVALNDVCCSLNTRRLAHKFAAVNGAYPCDHVGYSRNIAVEAQLARGEPDLYRHELSLTGFALPKHTYLFRAKSEQLLKYEYMVGLGKQGWRRPENESDGFEYLAVQDYELAYIEKNYLHVIEEHILGEEIGLTLFNVSHPPLAQHLIVATEFVAGSNEDEEEVEALIELLD